MRLRTSPKQRSLGEIAVSVCMLAPTNSSVNEKGHEEKTLALDEALSFFSRKGQGVMNRTLSIQKHQAQCHYQFSPSYTYFQVIAQF